MSIPQYPQRVLAVDLSAWQGRPDPEWFRSLRNLGYGGIIVQLWGGLPTGGLGPNPHAAYVIEWADYAEFPLVGGYIYLPPDADDQTHLLVATARGAAGPYWNRLDMVAIDIEDERPIHPGLPYVRLSNCANDIRQLFPQAAIAVYTSRYYWPKSMGSENPWPEGEAEFPLWDAAWVHQAGMRPAMIPDLDAGFTPYGGWTQRAAWQFAGNCTIEGVTVDENIIDLQRLGITDPNIDADCTTIDDLKAKIYELEARLTDLENRIYRREAP